jgi:hypothetical protein
MEEETLTSRSSPKSLPEVKMRKRVQELKYEL